MRKKFFILIFIISILAISASYSQDLVDTDLSSVITLQFNDITKETILNDPRLDFGECCSVVLQVDNNTTAFSFRRDAQYSADIFINNYTVGDKQIVKQYKESNGYFVQVIVTSDGYVVGVGGSSDGEDNKIIENETYKMLNNTTNFQNCDDNLNTIYGILSASNYGHYVVKAPNGTYHVVLSDRILHGTLKPGQYLSVPNKYSFYRTGDVKLSKNPLDQTINLAQTDTFGLTRRDITTFNITVQDGKTFVDIFASNDDGSGAGGGTAGLYDDIYANGTKTSGKDLPMAPDRTHLLNYTLENISKDGSVNRSIFDDIKFFLLGF